MARRKEQHSEIRKRSKLWKFKVPKAGKTFIWRASLEALPTKLNLFKRKMVDSSKCILCSTEPEFVIHALWSCKSAQDVWSSCSRRLQKCSVDETSFQNFLSYFFSTIPKEIPDEVAVTVYQLWRRSNSFVFGGKFTPLDKLALQSHQVLEDYRNSMKESEARVDNGTSTTKNGKHLLLTLIRSTGMQPLIKYNAKWENELLLETVKAEW
ncbi:uncharacterized protein LOC122278431 [Carya illinoinensis]|uniref:uncharacterized protein LOC122278431 n=1 Tax=Carya illinoinensis TaxID=32201 RepID=UPI001C721736|nr:uncharacterized protein LOC122278431 [Carya illinoinensis]